LFYPIHTIAVNETQGQSEKMRIFEPATGNRC